MKRGKTMAVDEKSLFIRDEHLETYAESVAHPLRPTKTVRGRSLAADVRRSLREIERCRDALALRYQGLGAMPGGARWLLDNHYLARREGAVAMEALSGASLRAAEEGAVLLLLCRALARAGRGTVTAERLERFLRGFQRDVILTREELRLLPCGLRAALLELLAESCEAAEDERSEALFANIFSSLRYLASADLSRLLEDADALERLYRADPAGVYPLMDEESRAFYRRETARLARRRGVSEYKAGQLALSLARHGKGEQAHVGYWLLVEPLGSRRRQRTGGLYIAANVLLTLFFALLLSYAGGSGWVFALTLLPVAELVKTGLDTLLLRAVRCRFLPRLELRDGVSAEGKTLCVLSCLLTDETSGKELARRLAEHAMASRSCGENLLFALLADLPDTDGALPEGERWVAAAAEAVEALNERYGGGFFLLTRPRVACDGRYMGYERKRGALAETMALLRGEASGLRCAAGDAAALEGVQYLLALDSDTRLTPESARALIGTALHPLNRPVLDEKKRVVRAGYGILSPRLSTELPPAGRSDFARVFSPLAGADPYQGGAGEVYMDCFQSGGFAGKGLIHIDSYRFCMAGRVPEKRVLSHDALEGAFLRGGLVSDVELLDSFPATPLAYYKRLHRWVRGDWQNLPWLFGRGRALNSIERWRLFDSLRRSLTPLGTLAAFLVWFFTGAAWAGLAAAVALLAQALSLIFTAWESLFRREESLSRFYSAVFAGVGGGLVRTLLRLALLPIEAWFCADAIGRALWRMAVSKKRLLEWQTAGQSEGVKSGLWRCYKSMWPAAALGLWLLLRGNILGRAAGFLWLLSPLCAWLLGLRRRETTTLSERDRAYLRECAGDIWRYFDRFVGEEDHFLPPDNVQLRPDLGPAHRTSPTNIGLALLSALAALDLDLAEPEAVFPRVGETLATLERLEKWRGHLYNWYDTRSLASLEPRYVSTVDSGNLCACLTALGAGLREHGQSALAARAEALAEAMDFTPLFDGERQLLRIGVDPAAEAPGESWYDLMESEARLTAYIAIAKGDAPRRLWRRLSRAQVQQGGYRGMASWTGTMFEYLMPELLLPLYRESLLFESARFCLWAQKRRTAGTGRPWGVSESAYYALDAAMSYRYKAHGCAALALKSGMDEELVVSPYSSFLALTVEPKAALKNLRKFDALGLRGEYGFWEAVDYTPGRAREGEGAAVRCVMSHHLGMSMTAIVNLLCGGVMVRRFLDPPEMSAHTVLLQEKLPMGGVVLRRRDADVPARPLPRAPEGWAREGEGADFPRPAACLLASSVYSLLVTDGGLSRPRWGGVSPYLAPADSLEGGHGIELLLRRGGETLSLLPDIRRGGAGCRWRFSGEDACLSAALEGVESAVTLSLPRDEAGESRRVTLRCTGEAADAELALRFAPLLVPERDYRSHPAFAKLGLSAQIREGCLLFRRLARGTQGPLYLALACDRPCVFSSLPGGDGGRPDGPVRLTEEELFLTEPLTECAVSLRLEPGESVACRFALGCGHSAEEALDIARRGLSLPEAERADLPRRAAAVLGLGEEAIGGAWALLGDLCFPTAPGEGPHGRDRLWKFGISGDLPILCADFGGDGQLEAARELMDRHLLLCACGADFDLVFFTHDANRYHKPLRTALDELLWHSGGDLLAGARGGVHILDAEEDVAAVRACAAAWVDLAAPRREQERDSAYRAPLLPEPVPVPSDNAALEQRWEENGVFSFTAGPQLPKRQWSHLLTGGRLGWLATDCGGGNLWYLNARENQLSPWLCQPTAVTGPEALFVTLGERRTSLFAEPGGERCHVSFAPGTAVWEKRVFSGHVRTEAFLPPEADARVLRIRCEGLPEGAMLHWRLELLLAGAPEDARYVRTERRDGALLARSDRAMAQAKPLLALSRPAFTGFTCDRAAALRGDYNGSTGLHARSVFALTLPAQGEIVLVCGCAEAESLRSLADDTQSARARTEAFWRQALPLTLRSPSASLDDLMNGWIGYQALACRLLGRCSLYQSGGAYGFRDQLQDSVNLLLFSPALAREQILRCCRRQYREGDAQHWWHEGGDAVRGVRTRCSDDLLWLPWAVCEYVEKTGDRSILDEKTPYLSSPPLLEQERDRYEAPAFTAETESVLDHCRRAMDAVLFRGVGAHGLLRFGSGDWNDGMDAVGGESQWLTAFYCLIAERFAALGGETYRESAAPLCAAIEQSWDGDWYRRGYFADGSPLGSRESRECRIDAIAQAFAALCPGIDGERSRRGLESAVRLLFDERAGLVRLFTPPFAGEGPDPGYIVSYGPGFRENGGQYTHGALWLVLALLRQGETDEGWRLLRALLPAEKDPSVYKAEPFVLSADVYTAPGHTGEAGWSWYTGSAGWMLRIVTEELLGLRLRGGRLYVEPRLPSDWEGYEIELHGRRIAVHDGEITVDGTAYDGGGIDIFPKNSQ